MEFDHNKIFNGYNYKKAKIGAGGIFGVLESEIKQKLKSPKNSDFRTLVKISDNGPNDWFRFIDDHGDRWMHFFECTPPEAITIYSQVGDVVRAINEDDRGEYLIISINRHAGAVNVGGVSMPYADFIDNFEKLNGEPVGSRRNE